MTPEQAKEKFQKKQRSLVKSTCERLKMQFSFKNIKTWRDIYKSTGYDEALIATKDNRDIAVTFDDVKAWCSKLTNDLENSFKGVTKTNEVKQEQTKPTIPDIEVSSNEIVNDNMVSNKTKVDTTTTSESQAATEVESKVEEDLDNDYGLIPSPLEKAYLYHFQKKATKELLDKITIKKLPAVLLRATTGAGKTFITAALDRRLKDMKFEKDKSWGLTNYLSVTRSTVVEQTKRVNQKFFSISHPDGTEVINIEQLRSRAGQMWVESKQVIVNGEEQEEWKWKPMINPCVIFLDECQAVKNESSTQHKILTAFTKIQTPTTQVFISATPFTRVSEAKAFAIATKKDISHIIGIEGTKLSEATWPTYAQFIAGDVTAPDEYNEAAVERLMKDLDEYIVKVKGIKWQFNAINKVALVDFDPPSEENDFTDAAQEYADAWIKYQEMLAKLDREVTENPRLRKMVEQGIFLGAAEYSKRYLFAKEMYNNVKNGYAAVLSVKRKKTVIAVTKILSEKYGVSRDLISLIWGGGQTALTAKQKLKAKVRENAELFEAQGISMQDMLLDEVEDRELEDLPEHLRLGNQSRDERQREIDKFQYGKSVYAIFTEAAGGVGLSLHHTDEFTTKWDSTLEGYEEWIKTIEKFNSKLPPNKQVQPGKVRRHKNGYAYVEDIKYIPIRQRKTIIGPTWSPIAFVQKFGRVPRLTSLSDTEQTYFSSRGTIEESQSLVVMHRLKCLSKVSGRENWLEMIEKHARAKEIARELVEKGPSEDKEGEEHESAIDIEEEE